MSFTFKFAYMADISHLDKWFVSQIRYCTWKTAMDKATEWAKICDANNAPVAICVFEVKQ